MRNWGPSGVFTNRDIGTEGFGGGKDAEMHKWHDFDLNNLTVYKPHTNTGNSFYVDHMKCYWYIKTSKCY